MHGFCSSPVLCGDKVIINGDHDGDSYLVALDCVTGRTIWKTMRENKTRSYCAPLIRNIGGRRQMILSGDKCVASYDPRTGGRHWVIDGPTDQFVASPVQSEKAGLVFVTGGYPDHHILAIRPDGQGNVTDTHIVWRTKRGVAYVPSPIIEGDYFLIVSDSSIAHCFEAATGKLWWQERMGEHHASLVSANGLVYFLNGEGVTHVVKPAPQFELVARNELREQCFASPAISQGKIFLRGHQHLFCIGKPGEPEQKRSTTIPLSQRLGKWVSLFNGRDLEGWTVKIKDYPLNENYGATFRVENGILKVGYDQYKRFDGKFGHLFYKNKFSKYRLRAEYRFVGQQTPGGPGWALRNSGIMFHSQSPESMRLDQDFPVSIEVQLLGGDGQAERSTANLCTPGTHVVIEDELITRHCTNSRSKTYHGDQWVTVEVEVSGNSAIKHIVNGGTVLAYQKPQLDDSDSDARKLMIKTGEKMLGEGYIALQAESHPVEFRKVEILPLD